MLETKTISIDLFKLMIPILLLVKLLELLGATTYLASFIAPLMSFIGLPPEIGMVWAGAMLSNIYTGMVLFISDPVSSNLSVIQVTVLGLLLLFAHSMPVELRIAQKIGVPLFYSLPLRILAAYAAAACYFQGAKLLGVSDTPVNILWQPDVQQQTLLQWGLSQCKLLLQIVVIIAVLILLLRAIKLVKLDRLIQITLRPILPLLGLTDKAVNIALVGFTLGLTYGGALLIQESHDGKLSARELFFSVSLLLICHGLIEDTLLILLLGANIYGILGFRLLFSFIVIGSIVFFLRSRDEKFFRKYLLKTPA